MDTKTATDAPAGLGHIAEVRVVHTDTDANVCLAAGWELLAAGVGADGTPTMVLGRGGHGCGCYTICENPGDCPHPT